MKKKRQISCLLFVLCFLCGIAAGAGVAANERGIYAAGFEPGETGGSYKILFYEDFGDDGEEVSEQIIGFGETACLDAVPWYHEGYRFEGWYCPEVGINHALANAYRDGAAVQDLGRFDGDEIHLYAGWRKV